MGSDMNFETILFEQHDHIVELANLETYKLKK